MYIKKFYRLYMEDMGRYSRSCLVVADRPDMPDTVSPSDAVMNKNKLDATFVYAANQIVFEDERSALDFVEKISALLAERKLTRAFIWLTENGPVVLGVGDGCELTLTFCSIGLGYDLGLEVRSGRTLRLVDGTLEFGHTSADNPPFVLNPMIGSVSSIYMCRLDVEGDLRGCLSFKYSLRLSEFVRRFEPGMRLAYKGLDGNIAVHTFPFLQASAEEQTLMFDISVYPCDVFNDISELENTYSNHKTYFAFRDAVSPEGFLNSAYQTVYGSQIRLKPELSRDDGKQPGRFTFVRNLVKEEQRLCPEGDFIVENPQDPNYLLCGLNGTEAIAFREHDRMRFLSNNPAFVKKIKPDPPEVGKVDDLEAPLIFPEHKTSWCAIIGDKTKADYMAQPKGFALYGSGGAGGLLKHERPGAVISDEAYAPLFPYALCGGDGLWLEELEKSVVSVVRKQAFTRTSGAPLIKGMDANSLLSITTPSGHIVELTDTAWESIRLGRGEDVGSGTEDVYFEKPDIALINAFQAPNLFLVAANGRHLGEYTSNAKPLGVPAFHNTVHVQGFLLRSNVGEGAEYGKYASIMIVKGCKGRLYDQNDEQGGSLVANPDFWRERASFSSPVTSKGEPDPSQQLMLSQWLLAFFRKAAAEKDKAYFDNFNQMAANPSWQGVLFLNLPLSADNLPPQMSGVLSGVPKSEKLCIHHWGITVNVVRQEGGRLQYDKSSSVFGLIYYKNPALPQSGGVTVVSPDSGDYNFKLLTLKVLFENAAIKSMECYAQLTLNKILGMSVSGMGPTGNEYNTSLMKGLYQNRGGVSTFSLRSVNSDKFLFKDCAVACVGLSNVEMTTRDSKNNLYWFGLEGLLDFKREDCDIYSLGSENEAELGERGLCFKGMGLSMQLVDGVQVFAEDISGCTPDSVRSAARGGSLYSSFRLEVLELIHGDKETTPEKLGYVPLAPGYFKSGLTDEWYGFSCKIILGTLGELAGKVGLDAKLMICWSSSGGGCVALYLPGAGDKGDFLSIQNILKLSCGSMRLGYYKTERVFYLVIGEIALKAFGIAKLPPSGVISMYLYGSDGSSDTTPIGWYAQYLKK